MIQLMQEAEYDKAIELGEKLVAQNPDNSQAYRFLLQSAIAKGEGEKYSAKYQGLVQANPDIAGYHFAIGFIKANFEDYDVATLELQRAIELNPQIEHAHYMLGAIYLNSGYSGADPEKALSEWQKEEQLNPQSLGALQVYASRADYYLRTGNGDAAEKDYEKMAMYAFAPGDREGARNRINQIRSLRDELARLEAEAKSNPDNPDTLFQLGIIQYNNAKMKYAIETWQKAAKLDPNNANLRNYLGKALLETRHLEDAVQHLQKAIELDPNMPAVYYNLAIAEESLGKTTMAVEHYKKYIELYPMAPALEEIKQRIAILEGNAGTAEEG
jgi:tetratricopeptide (TPR) repeat protein